MHSTDKPVGETRQRIFEATLNAVQQRRRRRNRNNVALTVLFGASLCVFGFWQGRTSDVKLAKATAHPVNVAKQEPTPAAIAPLLIERLPLLPLQTTVRISSKSTELIERIGNDPERSSVIKRINDQELLASLPINQAAGLVRFPDGNVRLFLLK
ncbi:MAG: hypothetical protein KDN22_32300 [Verrucomicrobiae bacterium]|nr:hypothetical protein [Verrucomicrobiae bacterium]